MFHLTPLEQIWPLKKISSGSSDPTVSICTPQNPCVTYGKCKKLKIGILILPWSKDIPNNLKGNIQTLKHRSNMIYRPHHSQMCQNCSFSTKMAIFDKNATMGPTDHIQNVFNRLDISFWVIWNIF